MVTVPLGSFNLGRTGPLGMLPTSPLLGGGALKLLGPSVAVGLI